jgi:hypothetical protein
MTLAACSPAQQAEQKAAPNDAAAPVMIETLTAAGWGPLHIGMSKADVIAAVGASASGGADPDADACTEFHPANAPEGVWVMLEEGVLTRITLTEPSVIKTEHDLAVGASAQDVTSAYGAAARSSPHQYQEAPARYLTVWTPPRPAGEQYVQDAAARGVRYVVGSDGKVESIHAGGPSIQYVEGCS